MLPPCLSFTAVLFSVLRNHGLTEQALTDTEATKGTSQGYSSVGEMFATREDLNSVPLM